MRNARKAEKGLHRALHLGLARGAIAGDRPLHLGRGQGEQGHLELARGEVDDAPRMAHQHGRARELVLGVEILDDQQARRVRLDEAVHGAVDGIEPRLQDLARRRADHARIDHGHAARPRLEHPEPGRDQPGIHSHDLENAVIGQGPRRRRWRR
jgi:hypothetical protein